MMNYPTKEQLENDYFNLEMTHDQIAIKYGFKTRQPIGRLFKKYSIKCRTKSESAKLKDTKNNLIPPKEVLQTLYIETNSISQISKILNVTRKRVSEWMKYYKIDVTYFKNNICNEELFQDLHFISVKEASIKYGISTTKIKVRVPNIPEIKYDKFRLNEIISLYDLNNQGFSKAITLDDKNVYNSILDETDDHFLYGNKITERVYRILNNLQKNEIIVCKSCGEKLKFYTIKMGYGNSQLQICSRCVAKQSAISKPSQELFWSIYKKINPINCYFSDLNHEKTILVTESDKKIFSNDQKLNKRRYVLDFVMANKIIEFDGRYWHMDEEKEKMKDKFLKYKGYEVLHIFDDEYLQNKELILNKCIKFLSS